MFVNSHVHYFCPYRLYNASGVGFCDISWAAVHPTGTAQQININWYIIHRDTTQILKFQFVMLTIHQHFSYQLTLIGLILQIFHLVNSFTNYYNRHTDYSPTKSLVPPARFQNPHPNPDPWTLTLHLTLTQYSGRFKRFSRRIRFPNHNNPQFSWKIFVSRHFNLL